MPPVAATGQTRVSRRAALLSERRASLVRSALLRGAALLHWSAVASRGLVWTASLECVRCARRARRVPARSRPLLQSASRLQIDRQRRPSADGCVREGTERWRRRALTRVWDGCRLPPVMSHRSNKPTAPAAASEASKQAPAAADDADMHEASAELDYEAQRQRQIQRNQALLTQLTGVEGVSTSLSREQVAAAAEARAAAAQIAKQARAQARAERAERLALLPRRDLPPRRARAELNYAEDAIAAERASHGSTAAAAAAASPSSEDADAPPRENASLSDFVVADNSPIARSSSGTSSKLVRTLPLSRLVAYLGLSIPLYHTPKASAMSFLVAGWPSESNPRSRKAPPTFNKMSGIQKLANHVAVFVNVDPPAEGATAAASLVSGSSSSNKSIKFEKYSNQWSENGRCLTWFAQPTQRVGTPVIGTMLAAARAKLKAMRSAGKEDEEYAAAVLGDAAAAKTATAAAPAKGVKRRKVRRADDEPQVKSEPTDAPLAAATTAAASSSAAAASSTAASSPSAAADDVDDSDDDGSFDPPSLLLFLRHVGGPYVFAGPLAYRSHDTTRTPMQFVFELAEFDRLLLQGDFRKLLPDGGRAAMAYRDQKAAAATSDEADTTTKQNKKARK